MSASIVYKHGRTQSIKLRNVHKVILSINLAVTYYSSIKELHVYGMWLFWKKVPNFTNVGSISSDNCLLYNSSFQSLTFQEYLKDPSMTSLGWPWQKNLSVSIQIFLCFFKFIFLWFHVFSCILFYPMQYSHLRFSSHFQNINGQRLLFSSPHVFLKL